MLPAIDGMSIAASLKLLWAPAYRAGAAFAYASPGRMNR
jgi:hypothetical protein